MALTDNCNIEITTLINPHLFWIVVKSQERRRLLTDLNKQLLELCNVKSNVSKEVFEVGEIVAAQINNKLYRATIEDVDFDVHDISYLVWLIDFGTLRECKSVFKLPALLRKSPPLSFQASLNKVVYIEKSLDYNESGNVSPVTKHKLNPSPISRQAFVTLLAKAFNIKFRFEKKEDGIVFGDIIYLDKDNNQISIRECLQEKEILVVDEDLFEGITDFINNYKENHLMLLSKICNKEPYQLEAEEENLNVACTNIVSKILDEFDISDILNFEDENAIPLWRSKKSKNNTMSSLDSTISDSETPTKIKSKRERLMEKLRQKINSKKSDTVTSESTDDICSENQSVESKPKEISTSKFKTFLNELKQRKQTNVKSPSGETNSKIIFTAAGCERAFTYVTSPRKKKEFVPHKHHSNGSSNQISKKLHTNYSSDDSINNRSYSSKTNIKQNSNTESSDTSFSKNQTDTEEERDKDISEEKETSAEKESSTEENLIDHKNTVQPVGTLKIKPHCSCKQCNMWTKEENIFIEKLPQQRKVNKIVGVNKQLLLKEKNDEKCDFDIHICSVDYSTMKKIEKQAMQKVLVHSESILTPIQQVPRVAFDRHIQNNLYKLQFREAKRMQSYAWPAILRNQHVFMIHGPKTGKTMAYLPVMCTFILEKHDRYDSLLKVAGGPIVIIICENTSKCEEIYDLAKLILGNLKANVSLVTYPLAHVNTSHTDMLITTPYILIDLLKNKSINFKRLCHLIIEDGDTILHKYKEPMNAIFELAQSMLQNRVFTKALQLIVCAEHWNSHIKYLMTNLQQVPMMCIGNYLEAALYGQLEFSMKFLNSSCKDQELRHLLKESHRINRSIIICKEDEIDSIHEIMTLKGIDNIPISASMSQEDIRHYEVVWTEAKGGNYSVLICSDFILHTLLSVTCATTLIHYSLPTKWSMFLQRFCCLLENCHSPLETTEARIISKNVVLCDETSKEKMHKFFSYINSTDLKKQLPEKLQQFSETLECAEEEHKLKKVIGLCDNLKLFGKCTKRRCSRRHLINANVDISNYLPDSGKIKFKIVTLNDVTSYSIQLLQHVDFANKINEYEECADITEDLTATLRLGRKIIHDPVVGHHYAFYNFDEDEGTYYRCEILDIDNDDIKIKLLDKGTVVSTLISRIYRLPKEFNCDVKPRAIIDAYLANFVPPYNDGNFSAKSFFHVKTLLEKHDYKNIIFSGEVHLQLNYTLWLKNVSGEIILSDQIIPGFQLSREIALKKLVDSDPNQLKNLYELCSQSNIVLPKYEQPKKINDVVCVKKEKIKKQWAHLESDGVNEVTFASAFSPEEVYVRLNKFSDLLYKLQKEIQQSLKKPNYPKLQEVEVGEVYLAKDSVSEEYCRVLVLKKECDKALCFYLDFADETVLPIEELKYIQPDFINKLPFQCIQCRLYGIKPFSETWEEDATELLYKYAHEPDTDIFRSLYLKVCKKESSTSPNGTKYSVILKDGFGEKNVVINKLLIDCGLVTNNDEGIKDFEIPIVKQEDSDSNDELDQLFQYNGNASTEVEPDYNEMEVFTYGDPMDIFFQTAPQRQVTTSTRNNELPAITAAPQVDYCTPEVYWSQTEKHIKFSIKLIDVKDYKLKLIKGRILNFRTIKDNKTYCLKMMFYERVETLQHTSIGPEIRVTLTKLKYIDWPRLMLSKQKARNIHYDIMKIYVDDKKQKFLQLPKELDDEDSEGLNEDDPMYTVVSDLDSDLDIELPHDSD